jgi:elongation factor Tu
LELVELEVRDLLSTYEVSGRQDADHHWLGAEGAGRGHCDIGTSSVEKLVAEMDKYIPVPERLIDGPF